MDKYVNKHALVRYIFYSLLCLLAGCGGIRSYLAKEDSPPAIPALSDTIKIKKNWVRDTGSENEYHLKLLPVIQADTIYTIDNKGRIQATSTDTGRVKWKKKALSSSSAGLGIGGGQLLAGTDEGEVLALQADTGDKIWQTRLSSTILTPPQHAGEVVIVRTIDGKIFALDDETGEQIWVYEHTSPSLTLRGNSRPVIYKQNLIVGLDNGKLIALTLKGGEQIWELEVASAAGDSEIERLVDIDANLLLKDSILYAASFQGPLIALDLENGRQLWSRPITCHTSMDADARRIYITDQHDHIWALDRFSGITVWEQAQLHKRALTGPRLVNDLLVVGDVEGYLHWINSLNGERVAYNRMAKGNMLVAPLVMGDTLYAYNSHSILGSYSYDQAAFDKYRQRATTNP